jgi:hypothetical protein
MQEIKNIAGIVAILLTFVGYIPYIKDTIREKTNRMFTVGFYGPQYRQLLGFLQMDYLVFY